MRGKLISFEGGEGSGKSTQAKLLYQSLKKTDPNIILTREPGGTPAAEEIRKILVTGDKNKLQKESEVLLHYAARNEHIEKLIKPSISEGKTIITDRFYDSTIAYQGYGHGVDISLINVIHNKIIEDFTPDITFLFDIDAKKGLERSNKRIEEQHSNENRYESLGLEFHQNVRDGFLAIAKANPKRVFILNAEEPIEYLQQKVIDITNQKI